MSKPIASALAGIILITALFALGLALGLSPFDKVRQSQTSQNAFEAWLDQSPHNRKSFADFAAFLDREGVAEVVPVWQLTRVDGARKAGCNSSPFAVPPKESWPKIIPALQLEEARIKPAIGEVEVVSAYRQPDINRCASGATRSRHLTFEALDLRAISRPSNAQFFRRLCDIWREAGPASKMGMGAYYDPKDNSFNPIGRFHVDASGYRTWGRDYSSDTSPCLQD